MFITEQLNNDVWELLEPKDIHSQIPQSFYKLLADEKWQERMKGLELLFKLLTDCKRIADDPGHKQLIASLGKVCTVDF